MLGAFCAIVLAIIFVSTVPVMFHRTQGSTTLQTISIFASDSDSFLPVGRVTTGLGRTQPNAQSSDKYTCPKCGKTYAHQGSLWRHQCKCEGRFMECCFCQQLFYRKDYFRQHLLSKHQYVDETLGAPGFTLSVQKQ